METIRSSWKAIVALLGTYVATQLPQIELFVQDWVQGLVSSVFVAIAVWLKANEPVNG